MLRTFERALLLRLHSLGYICRYGMSDNDCGGEGIMLYMRGLCYRRIGDICEGGG